MSEKKIAIHIITKTFNSNPSVLASIGSQGNLDKKLKRLADYAFVKSKNRSGVYLSENKKGVAFCYQSNCGKTNLNELWKECRLAATLPVSIIRKTLKREAYIKKFRYSKPHLYFWFLGVEKGGGKATFEIKDLLFSRSQNEQLPIVLETSVMRNKIVYERYGFEVYHQWNDGTDGEILWFMIRKP